MPRIELTLKTDYVPNWNVDDGIREFVSNAQDAKTQYGDSIKIDWYLPAGETTQGTLRIENTGSVLSRETLLFGQSTKYGQSQTIGSFGEGSKLATLALL